MSAKVLGLLLLAWQIILIQSAAIQVEEPVAYHSTRLETQSSTLPQGYRAFPDVHSAFKVYEVDTTWFEARARCLADGARLAIADTLEKIAHINSMKTPSGKWLHVGIFKAANGQWVRIYSGLPGFSIPWIKDNPVSTGNCAGISFSQEIGLINYPCEWEYAHYVCEIPESPTLPQGYRAFYDINSAFKIYEIDTTWIEARDRCTVEGAHLATADTRKKIAHINSMKTPSSSYKWLHVGIHKINGQWVRIDRNNPLSSVPWAKDNPDDTGDCAAISFADEGLVDLPCGWYYEYYVCEISL